MSVPEPAGREPAKRSVAGGHSGRAWDGGHSGRAQHSSGDLSSTLGELSTPELAPSQRRRLLRHLTRQLPPARAWRRPATAVRWAADSVGELAPHVPVRSLAALHEHHPGLLGDPLAERLVRNAARAAAGIGAASGGLAAVKWTVPPTLLAAPVLLCVETVAVVAIEIKLIGELHVAYRMPIPGTRSQRAVALLQAWARQRGVNPLLPGAGITVALGTAARKELVERLARRYVRNLPTLAPLLAGAAVAGILNQRGTRALGRQVRADLARLTG